MSSSSLVVFSEVTAINYSEEKNSSRYLHLVSLSKQIHEETLLTNELQSFTGHVISREMQMFWSSTTISNLFYHAEQLREETWESSKTLAAFQEQRRMQLAMIIIAWIKVTYDPETKIILVPNRRHLQPIVDKIFPSFRRKEGKTRMSTYSNNRVCNLLMDTLVCCFTSSSSSYVNRVFLFYSLDMPASPRNSTLHFDMMLVSATLIQSMNIHKIRIVSVSI
jgi:hypothetical protein